MNKLILIIILVSVFTITIFALPANKMHLPESPLIDAEEPFHLELSQKIAIPKPKPARAQNLNNFQNSITNQATFEGGSFHGPING